MISLILKIDTEIALFFHRKFSDSSFREFVVKINRGEISIPVAFVLLFLTVGWKSQYIYSFFYIVIFCFLNDRFVLFIKKKISRRRPSLKLLGKPDNHPDLNHSFPSAHAANSLAAVVLLNQLWGASPFFVFISFLAGLGRMITLHHFLSDVIGGWLIGLTAGLFGSFLWKYFILSLI